MGQVREASREGGAERDIILQAVHDIRSPLSVLRILLARLEHSNEPFQRDLIAAVFQRIEEISQDLLGQCRPPTRNRTLAFALRAVVQEKMIEYGTQVKLHFGFDPAAGEIRVDSCEIMRALSNLINNAVEAGAKSVRVDLTRSLDYVHLSVSDDGAGFPTGVLRDLQMGAAAATLPTEHGFGLRHLKIFAEKLNGKIWLTSSPTVGSCITLALPSAAIQRLAATEA